MSRPVVAITIGRDHYGRMFDEDGWRELERFADVLHHTGAAPAAKADLLVLLPRADACITSWDVAPLDADVVAAAPRLRAMAHMGGSVARFVSPAVWARGIQVTSTASALARDVAETTVGLMIVGAKHIWPLNRLVHEGGWRAGPGWPSRELHSCVVGLIGAGNVGRHVVELLRPFRTREILLYDPFVSEAEAIALGVTKAELPDLVRRASIISLHAPAKADTYHMVDQALLQSMQDDTVIINTARGALIDETALIDELSKGRLFAFLDVTDPEPPLPDSRLRQLTNVVVTPHLAGCIHDCSHMGKLAVEELRRFFAGEPPLFPVTLDQFGRIA